MKRMACAVALAAGSGLAGFSALPALAEPSPATAASGLQVSIVPPGAIDGSVVIPLDVKFNGGNIRTIELFIDGARLSKNLLNTRDGRGVVHFTMDPSLLTEGSHEVLIKAYDADGTCATTTSRITIAPADLNALARFEWPKRNSEVEGVLPIKIKIDPSIVDPYVTYTVDNDFLAFRNYAPYVYNWDTAKVNNGRHTIGIEVMDGRTLQVVQKLSVTINVKNPGGFTHFPKNDQPIAKPDTGTVPEIIKGEAVSALPDATLSLRDTVLGLARNSAHGPQIRARSTAPATGFRSTARMSDVMTPRRSSPFIFTVPAPFDVNNLPLKNVVDTLQASMASISKPDSHHIAAKTNVQRAAPGFEALAADPMDLMPALSRSTFGIARQSVHFRHNGSIALRPSTERRASSHVSTTPAAAITTPTLPAFHAPKRRTFDVAFNNTLIKFDVAPRVENGLPLAPFRAIFEHNGGTVKWNNDAKVVRAFDNEHEIEITIGSKEAKVNNVAVSMEATPYLDHGRTIVPLSFVRDAMDLKVTFDQETGHLMIEKK